MFRWENPFALYYLWLLPIFVVGALWLLRRANLRLQMAFGQKLTPLLTSSVSPQKRRWKIYLQAICVAFMILTWARPQAGQSKQEIKSEGVEIAFVADVSLSMMADDVRPSRLDQAKVDMSHLTEMMSGNKIALIGFAGSAALLSPLTTDPSSLKLFIDALNTSSVSTQGTNFKAALDEAKSAFERGGVTPQTGSAVTRVIVILSDGEDHEQGALDAAKKYADEGIRIFTLAYGTQKGAPIPERDSLGYLKGYKKDRGGKTVLSSVNGEALQALAQAGRGQFYFASPGGNYLHSLLDEINKLEKTQFDSEMAVQYDEKFQWFLILALIFGVIELLLGERRPQFKLWKGRFEVPPA